METYTLSQFPLPYSTIHLALFHNVTNSPTIRKRLFAASTASGPEGDKLRDEVDYAFLDARLVVSRDHLLSAISTTLLSSLPPTSSPTPTPITRTHNLHSELLLSLSPNNNISDSVRRHGIGDSSDMVLVVRIGNGGQRDVFEGIRKVVEGDLVAMDEFRDGVDWTRVDKIYKLNEMNHLPLPPTEILKRKVAAVVNTVAIKAVT